MTPAEAIKRAREIADELRSDPWLWYKFSQQMRIPEDDNFPGPWSVAGPWTLSHRGDKWSRKSPLGGDIMHIDRSSCGHWVVSQHPIEVREDLAECMAIVDEILQKPGQDYILCDGFYVEKVNDHGVYIERVENP